MTEPTTVDAQEVDKFSALAAEWWDPKGKFAVLHKFNPVRLAYIRETLCTRFARDPLALDALSGLRILDIGCGGGLLSEPLTRLGAEMVGADPAERNIKTAMVHAAEQELVIDYRATTAEALADAGERFDVVLNMEVVEHVADPALFVRRCAEMVRPGGVMVMATINRTLKSFGLAIIGAEYLLGWLPRGTHQWEKFITPDELAGLLADAGLSPEPPVGVVYRPLTGDWARADDTDVNYMLTASKPDGATPG